MRRVFRAPNLVDVVHAQNLLTVAGLHSALRHQYLAGAAGDLPTLETWPQLVVEDHDEMAALRVLREAGEPRSGMTWTCTECHETLDPQFTACWRCGRLRE